MKWKRSMKVISKKLMLNNLKEGYTNIWKTYTKCVQRACPSATAKKIHLKEVINNFRFNYLCILKKYTSLFSMVCYLLILCFEILCRFLVIRNYLRNTHENATYFKFDIYYMDCVFMYSIEQLPFLNDYLLEYRVLNLNKCHIFIYHNEWWTVYVSLQMTQTQIKKITTLLTKLH